MLVDRYMGAGAVRLTERKHGFELTAAPLFEDIKPATLQELMSGGRIHGAERYSIIGVESLSQRLFLLIDGRMKMVRPSCGGDEVLIQSLIPGDIFCAVAMLAARPCCSYAQCLGVCEYVSWTHRLFRRLMTIDEQLQTNLLSHLAAQIEEERDRRCLTQCVNVHARVAVYLLSRCDAATRNGQGMYEVDLRPLSLTAQEIGIARETLSRTLTAFGQEQILCSRRGVVELHSTTGLRAIADGKRTCGR